MNSLFAEKKDVIKATVIESTQSKELKQSKNISSEPLNNYILKFRNELRSEISGISKIKWG